MATPITTSDPVSPLENLINPGLADLTALQLAFSTGSGRGTSTVYTTTNLAGLDAITSAVIGDIAYMTTPGTGIDALKWEAYAGSGSGIDWRIIDTVVAATKANMDSFIAAVAAVSDTRFRIGSLAHVTATLTSYRFSSTTGALAALPGIVKAVSVSGGTLGANGSVALSSSTGASFTTLFSDDYDDYSYVLDLASTAGSSDVVLLLRTGGADITTGYINKNADITASNTVSPNASPSTVALTVGRVGPAGGTLRFSLHGPKLARETIMLMGGSMDMDNFYRFGGGYLNNTTSYTDCTVKLSSGGAMTGELRVSGLVKG